ncbi:DUF3489 domain-containing protein [Sphingomonas rhizophila]|nr:DUF3489 domain-containing protein [Sphingomonas rhizophila]
MTKPKSKMKTAHTAPERPPSKLDLLVTALGKKGGATIDELVVVTGWQKHSVRGAMSGSLRKKGFTVTSEKIDGIRRYRTELSA